MTTQNTNEEEGETSSTMTTTDLYESGYEYFTESQSKAISLGARIAASVSICCALYMIVKCYQSRDRIFHRLMLCLSVYLVTCSIWTVYGTSAVPYIEDAPFNVWGAAGTTKTCTAQGFFSHISQAIGLYYTGLSVYSLQAVRFNFQVQKYQWIEKYIHFFIALWAFGSGFYLLSLEAFNPSPDRGCYIHSRPLACEHHDIECTRGPDNVEQLAWLFAALPGFLVLLTPTIVMGFSILYVYRNQRGIVMQWKVVAKQGILFLFAIYWTYLFIFVNAGSQYVSGKTSFPLSLLSGINVNLEGVWTLLVYRYFGMTSSTVKEEDMHCSHTSSAMFDLDDHSINIDPPSEQAERSKAFSAKSSSGGSGTKSKPTRDRSAEFQFNIFDGTNPSGPFAKYVLEGDEEDKTNDCQESQRWDTIQSHV